MGGMAPGALLSSPAGPTMPHTMKRLGELHEKLAINKKCDLPREEYLDHMTFRANRRPLFTEIFGPLLGLKEEWAAQGATPDELDMSVFRYRCPAYGGLPVHTGFIRGFEEQILEEGDDYVIARDHMGRLVKMATKAATIPLPLEHPVADMDDWRRFKHHYEFDESRFGANWERLAREHLAAGRVVAVGMPGAYATMRELMGAEAACMVCYDEPELAHDVLKTLGDTVVAVLDRVSRAVTIDMLGVHEDMAGRSGPLWGPRQVQEFMRPYYRRVWDMLRQRGCQLFNQDSDGNVNAIIPDLLECGLNMMHPMEPAAGMDVVEVRRKYGRRLAFEGGIDKHVLRRGQEAIVAELEYKIPPLVASGGCVIALDHRIPNGTPLEAYRFYVAKAWEIMEREAEKLQ